MSSPDKTARLSRLTAILIKLQSKPLVSVKSLSNHFEVSTRTIYRDIQALEAAGIPILAVEGKGFALVDGYTIPPVMFSESEANALIIAEKIIATTKDDSLIQEFNKATDKIKAVLRHSEKQKSDLLSERIIIGKNWSMARTSSYLSDIQKALTNFQLIRMDYKKKEAENSSERSIEPFAIYHNTSENWVLIAWCRWRKDFRNFRLDRIQKLQVLEEKFTPHKMSLAEYVEIQRKKHFENKNPSLINSVIHQKEE